PREPLDLALETRDPGPRVHRPPRHAGGIRPRGLEPMARSSAFLATGHFLATPLNTVGPSDGRSDGGTDHQGRRPHENVPLAGAEEGRGEEEEGGPGAESREPRGPRRRGVRPPRPERGGED